MSNTNYIGFARGVSTNFSPAAADSNTLYFLTDTNQFFLGGEEYSKGVEELASTPTANLIGVEGKLYVYNNILYTYLNNNWTIAGFTNWTMLNGFPEDSDFHFLAYQDQDPDVSPAVMIPLSVIKTNLGTSGSTELADGSVTTIKIAEHAVTGGDFGKIKEATITGYNLAEEVVSGGVGGHIGSQTITGYNIADSAISLDQINEEETWNFKFETDEQFKEFLLNNHHSAPGRFRFTYSGNNYEGHITTVGISEFGWGVEAINLNTQQVHQWSIGTANDLKEKIITDFKTYSVNKIFTTNTNTELSNSNVTIGTLQGYSSVDGQNKALKICIAKDSSENPVWFKIAPEGIVDTVNKKADYSTGTINVNDLYAIPQGQSTNTKMIGTYTLIGNMCYLNVTIQTMGNDWKEMYWPLPVVAKEYVTTLATGYDALGSATDTSTSLSQQVHIVGVGFNKDASNTHKGILTVRNYNGNLYGAKIYVSLGYRYK